MAMFGCMPGASFLPFLLVVCSSSACTINYIIAVLRGDVVAIWPYISDTGTTPPESCLFGLMTSITAMAGVATMYTRYKFIERLIERTGGVRPVLNKIALGIGLLSCLGMNIVATFQETVVTPVHDFGALLFFLSGVVYIVLQTWISYQAYPYGSSKAMCRTRALISSIAVVALFPTVICAIFVGSSELRWKGDEPNYGLHLASAVCEWMVAFSFVFFFFTYIREFTRFTMTVKAELVEQN
ncbi:DNA damage-regulated autophagy modulator protein 1 isoform X1 [Alosa sapidissima]|uniref:DNA damage-regulated autophagy modulator protein 1 isoform X1 n=1 Tax=Alosa sapidissima TaxID=34773 RepID=UPI001C09105E|nr:DNA damage-regulated autophagy modulator protein 1 isoform X1 [Alosa sapidissima]